MTVDDDVVSRMNTHQSVYREKLMEHLLIGELLKYSWFHHGATLEVSQPSIDRAGHDVVLEANGITRHVQLKTSSTSAKTANQKIHVGLSTKPSGCVIWVRFHPSTLSLGPFGFFGGNPGKPLPAIDDFKIAQHSKANAAGVKSGRQNLRVVPKAKFHPVSDLAELYVVLFGESKSTGDHA